MSKRCKITYVGPSEPKADGVLANEKRLLRESLLQTFKTDYDFRIKTISPKKCTKDAMSYIIDRSDIVHIDNAQLCLDCWKWGLKPPDVVGPYIYPFTSAPPTDRKDIKNRLLFRNWFYSSTVIRMANYPKEENREIAPVTVGIDTDMLEQYKIRYKGKVMVSSGGNPLSISPDIRERLKEKFDSDTEEIILVDDLPTEIFRRQLRKTMLYVCMSSFETFHRQAFEAMACGVPVIWPKGIHGGRWLDAGTKIDGTTDGFLNGVNRELGNPGDPRMLMTEKFTLDDMRLSYVNAYNQALERR